MNGRQLLAVIAMIGSIPLLFTLVWFSPWYIVPVVMFGLVILIPVFIWLLSVDATQDTSDDDLPDPKTARLRELKVQYASGEIDEAEFERQVNMLNNADTPSASVFMDADPTAEPTQTSNATDPSGSQPSSDQFDQFVTQIGEIVSEQSPTTTEPTETESSTSGTNEGSSSTQRDGEPPEERLRRRFADGELTETEFRRRLAVLRETEAEAESETETN